MKKLLPCVAGMLIASSCERKPPPDPIKPPPSGPWAMIRGKYLPIEWVATDPERIEVLAEHRELTTTGILIGYDHERILYHHTGHGGPACDIAWLNKGRKIFEIDALNGDDEEGVTSKGEGMYALAAPPGWLKSIGAAAGDGVEFSSEIGAPSPMSTITVAGLPVHVEVSEYSRERMRGLMFRKRLSGHDGMLFIYRDAGSHSFWMHNCYFPLDIAYFDAAGKFVNMVPSAIYPDPKVDREPTSPSAGDAKYVLEVNLGWFKAHKLLDDDLKQLKEIVLQFGDDVKKLEENADP